jgi:hypothetical protein
VSDVITNHIGHLFFHPPKTKKGSAGKQRSLLLYAPSAYWVNFGGFVVARSLRKFVVLSSLGFMVAVFTGCGGGGNNNSTTTNPTNPTQPTPPAPPAPSDNPVPSIVARSAAQTLTITGTNFLSSTVVNFNSIPLTATYVSATSMTAALPATANRRDRQQRSLWRQFPETTSVWQ